MDFGNWNYQPSPWGSMLLGDEDFVGDKLMTGRDLKNCHKWGPYWMGDGKMPARNDSEELWGSEITPKDWIFLF